MALNKMSFEYDAEGTLRGRVGGIEMYANKDGSLGITLPRGDKLKITWMDGAWYISRPANGEGGILNRQADRIRAALNTKRFSNKETTVAKINRRLHFQSPTLQQRIAKAQAQRFVNATSELRKEVQSA